MASRRVAVVTGGMGGLGETISDQDGRGRLSVVVTYSPGNKSACQMAGRHEGARATTSRPMACDVTDFDSWSRLRRQGAGGGRPGRHPGQQRRHHPRHDLQEDGQGPTGTRCCKTNLDSVFNMTKQVVRRHDGARLGPHHQRLLGQRLQGRVRPDQLRRRQGRHARLHQVAGAGSGQARASPSTPSRRATSAPRW